MEKGFHCAAMYQKMVSFYSLLTSIVRTYLTERAEPHDSVQEKEKQTTRLVN